MGDLADIVTAGTALATVMESNVARAMPAHMHAIPRSKDLETLRGWQHHSPIGFRYFHSSAASRAGIASDSVFDVCVGWQYAGKSDGLGMFIQDAYVYCEITSVGLGHSYSVTAKFDDHASYEGDVNSPIAVVSGEADILHTYMMMTENSIHLRFEIKGDGSGHIERG